MQNPFQENLRKPWALFCTTLLVLYSIMPVEHETIFYFNSTSSLIEVLMFLLSFPLGDAFMFVFHSGNHGILERFLFWAAAMTIGYVQWFHLFPALLRRRRQPSHANTLNADAAGGVALAGESPLGLAAHAPDAERDIPPVRQFNERGMTPLERVFREGEEEEE